MLHYVRTGLLLLNDWLARSDTEHARFFIIKSIMKGRIITGDEPAEAEEAELDDWGVTQEGLIPLVAEMRRVDPPLPPKHKYKIIPGQRVLQAYGYSAGQIGTTSIREGKGKLSLPTLGQIILPIYSDHKSTTGAGSRHNPQHGSGQFKRRKASRLTEKELQKGCITKEPVRNADMACGESHCETWNPG